MQSNDALAATTALDELYGLGYDNYQKLKREIEGLTLEEVNRVAAKYFKDTPSVVATVRPTTKAAAAPPGVGAAGKPTH